MCHANSHPTPRDPARLSLIRWLTRRHRFKTFVLFPALAKLAVTDHFMRVLFPIAFLGAFLSLLSEVDIHRHYDLLKTSECYSAYK